MYALLDEVYKGTAAKQALKSNELESAQGWIAQPAATREWGLSLIHI